MSCILCFFCYFQYGIHIGRFLVSLVPPDFFFTACGNSIREPNKPARFSSSARGNHSKFANLHASILQLNWSGICDTLSFFVVPRITIQCAKF